MSGWPSQKMENWMESALISKEGTESENKCSTYSEVMRG